MSTAIHRRVEACRAGKDPTCIARLASGWAVMGDRQVLPGYSLLLPDPVVPHLNAMPADEQGAFLADVARLGQAVLEVTGALRINYAMFGNLEPALHAHVFPRFETEAQEFKTAHPWGYDWSKARPFDSSVDGALLTALRERLRNCRTSSPSDPSGAEHAVPRQT